MTTFNPEYIQTGDGNLAEPVHVGRPGQQVIFSSVDPANSYAAKYPTIESVPADFNGTVDIVTPTYRAIVKGDGTTKYTTGYSDSIADRPSAAALGKGSWNGNNISDGVNWSILKRTTKYVPSSYVAVKSATTTISGQSEKIASGANFIYIKNLDATNTVKIGFGTDYATAEAAASASTDIAIPYLEFNFPVPEGMTHYSWLGVGGTVSAVIGMGE